MAGPAGGRGGRQGGGGFSSGGNRGGGFGGGFYPYRRGGLLGGIMGIILLPIIIIFFAIIFLVVNLITTFTAISQGGLVSYDEEKFQNFANEKYYEYFTDKTTQEDGIMIFMLTYEDNYDYAYVAWAGDNINNDINDAFSAYGTFGDAMENNINADNYQYSLSKDLAKVVDTMTLEIRKLGLESSFVKEHDTTGIESKLIDKSGLNLNEETVNSSLEAFYEETDIPVVMYVVTAEEVFGKTMPIGNIVISVVTLIIIGVCVYYLVTKIRKNKMVERDLGPIGSFRINDNPPPQY